MIASVLLFAIVLVPFLLIGAWRRRRDSAFGPYFCYAIILFLFSAIVSAVHVPGGTFIHSAVALAPYGYLLALEGAAILAVWLATRRGRAVNVDGAVRLYIVGLTGLVVVLGLLYVPLVHEGWAERRDRFLAVGTALDEAGATQRRPGDVHRYGGHEVLDRASRGRSGERPSGHDRRRRGGLRHPLARHR